MNKIRYLIVGGAGFIGSNFVQELLQLENEVIVVDNLISGKEIFLEPYLMNENFKFINDDIKKWQNYKNQLNQIDVLIHLASNADISAAAIDPTLDFERGTVLTQAIAELSRQLGIKKIVYASGSGVYGDHGKTTLEEGKTELLPNSPYGASKLAGEAILSAYSEMFGIQVLCFRFANVVGRNQTHGVGLDFLKKLKENNHELSVLGDGSQSKSYIHVNEVIGAINFTLTHCKTKYFVSNITNQDRISVSEIAKLAIEVSGLDLKNVKINYGIGNKGWAGDVPTVILSPNRLKEMGWISKINSKKAIKISLESLWEQIS